MKKIIKYFPLNKGIVEEEIKTLIKAVAIYLGTAIVVLTIANVTDWIPVVRNLTFNLSNIYGYYILVGIALACYQYFMGKDYSEEEFVTLNDVKALWNSSKGKIILGAALVVLCLIPHKDKVKPVSVQEQVAQELEVQGTKAETIEIQETDQVVESEVVESEVVESEVEEQKTNELTETFYSYVKGCYQSGEIYYTFSRTEDNYYFINSNSVGDRYDNPEYHVAVYSVDKFEFNDNVFEATLSESGNTYTIKGIWEDGKCSTLTLFNGAEEVELTNISLVSYDELLAKDEYTSCYFLAYYYNNEEKINDDIFWFKYKKDEKMGSYTYDVSAETDGDELILRKEEYGSVQYTVLGLKDGIVIPLYERYSYDEKDMIYDEETRMLLINGYSGGTGYYYMDYSPNQKAYLVNNDTKSVEKKYKKPELIPLEELELCDRLVFDLGQIEGFPEGYSSAIWDDMTFGFNGMQIQLGKTLYEDFLASGEWDEGSSRLDSTSMIRLDSYEHTPDYISIFRHLEHKETKKTIRKNQKPLTVKLDLYTVKDFSRDYEDKIVYSFSYNCSTEVPEEISSFPKLELMGGITYNSTYEEVFEIYGTPTWIWRAVSKDINECQFTYVSEDYTKEIVFNFDSEGKLEEVYMANYDWFQDKTGFIENWKQDIVEERNTQYETLQKKSINRDN